MKNMFTSLASGCARASYLRILALAGAALALPISANAASITWTGGSSDGDWGVAANWTENITGAHTVPTSADTGRLAYNTTNEVWVTDARSALGVQFGNISGTGTKGTLRIKSGGALSLGTGGITTSDQTNGLSLLYVDSGGTLNVAGGSISMGRGNATTTNEFYINGGTISQTGAGSVLIGGIQTTSRATASLTQTGGSLSATALGLDLSSTETGNNSKGTYQVSGAATVTIANSVSNGGLSQNFDNGNIKITGSSVTFNVTAASGAYTQGAHSTLEFALDNGGASKINLQGATSTAALGTAGTLLVGFKAGAALTTTTSFRLIEAETVSGTFTNLPNSTLWSSGVQTSVSGTRDAYVVSYQASAKQGTNISITGTDATSFTATARGYTEVTGLTLNQAFTMNLDITSLLTTQALVDYFNANGLTASLAAVGPYDITLAWTAAANGSSYFAWDLTGYDATGNTQISAIQVVPEPATVWLMVAALGVFVVLAKRNRRQQVQP